MNVIKYSIYKIESIKNTKNIKIAMNYDYFNFIIHIFEIRSIIPFMIYW